MSGEATASGGNPRLVDTHAKTVHKLVPGAKHIIASHSHLLPPSPGTESPSTPPPFPFLLPPPHTHNEQYCCQLEVGDEGCGLVTVWVGECRVDGNTIAANENAATLSNESLLQLGQHLVLQFLVSSEVLPRRRMLPQTPGQQLSEAPPSKPVRTQPALPLLATTGMGSSDSFSIEAELDPGLRERLKRIAREVNSRDSGTGRSKPPPPYEQVGNSIGYQLLLQHHSNRNISDDVTTIMIDSLYPMLKYMQLKESSLEQFYSDYLGQYSAARREGATPTNMHPEDTPTIVFIVDTLIQLCSLPRVNELAVRYCPVWMRLLSAFCHAPRNQRAMATKRLATKVVSCMGLGIMSEQAEFQTHGWTVLTYVVATPTPRGSKPALPEPAIALALPLVERQLHTFGDQLPLATAILGFMSRLAATAKESQAGGGGGGGGGEEGVGGGEQEEEQEVYTEEQASRILRLLSEHNILRHVMKVPQQSRRDPTFDGHYCLLVKALVPTRKRLPKPSLTPSSNSLTCLSSAPPAKPKRIRRAMTETSIKGSRKSRKSRKSQKQRVSAIGEEQPQDSSPPGLDKALSLSEEKLTQCGKGEEEEEEGAVVRSEGEDVESEGEGEVERRLQEMRVIQSQQNGGMGNQQDGDMGNQQNGDMGNQHNENTGHHQSGVDNQKRMNDSQHDVEMRPSGTGSANEAVPQDTAGGEARGEMAGSQPSSPAATASEGPTVADHSPSPSPLSPDSLAGDIESALVAVRQPVRQYSLKRNPGQPEVCVPNVSGHTPYYQTSFKMKQPTTQTVAEEASSADEKAPPEETSSASDEVKTPLRLDPTPHRSAWSPVTPPILPLDHTHPLETSTELYSSDIQCGHSDVCLALSGRLELLQGVWSLWREGRGLQAATNAVRGCFSEELYDTALFCDILHCFCSFQSPWTLAVCVVLLPVVGQLLSSQREPGHVAMLAGMVLMTVQRFSVTILACRGGRKPRRLSAASDFQQKTACYTALHRVWVAMGNRLECKGQQGSSSNVVGQKGDVSGDVIRRLQELRKTLAPFSSEPPDC